MVEKYILDNLNQDNVSVSKQTYIDYMGQQYPVGELWRRWYVNSIRDREQVLAELPQEQQNAVFAIWGDAPTVNESIVQ